MQRQAPRSSKTAIEDFRRDLRVLEREIVRQLEGETTCCAVTLPQCHVLLELSFGDRSLSGLAAALDLDKSTLSRTVEALVQAGLAARTVDALDRRAVCLTLSPLGRERVATINQLCNRYYAALLDQMSPADRRQVVGVVRLLAEGMKRLRCASPVGTACRTPLSATKRTSRGRRPPARRPGKQV